MKSENKWRDSRLRPFLNSLPSIWWTIKEAKSIRGIPDIIGNINGRFFALELKKSKTAKQEPLQVYTCVRIRASGGFAEIIYPENAREVLMDLLVHCYGASSAPLLWNELNECFPYVQLQRAALRKKQ